MERDTPPSPDDKPSDLTWRWWEMMAPYMETNPDFSPVQWPVEEMFHFEHPKPA
jgi:L-rhamnose mutarotase